MLMLLIIVDDDFEVVLIAFGKIYPSFNVIIGITIDRIENHYHFTQVSADWSMKDDSVIANPILPIGGTPISEISAVNVLLSLFHKKSDVLKFSNAMSIQILLITPIIHV